MKILGTYRNGNYIVTLYEDGTKTRITGKEEFIPSFPESIDLKITDYCEMNCPYCHEDSSINGLHGDLSAEFINTLHPFTELAIGGGNPLSHPGLEGFLWKLKEQKIIANITVNQYHFLENLDLLHRYSQDGLVHGVGISVSSPTRELLNKIKNFPNAVVHVIAGLVSEDMLEAMADLNLNLLILGYKELRRGLSYLSPQICQNTYDLAQILPQYYSRFKVISFDNLAIKQLKLKTTISKEDWEKYYLGDDGQYTMYIDLVNNEYALNSTYPEDKRKKLKNNIEEMFNDIRE